MSTTRIPARGRAAAAILTALLAVSAAGAMTAGEPANAVTQPVPAPSATATAGAQRVAVGTTKRSIDAARTAAQARTLAKPSKTSQTQKVSKTSKTQKTSKTRKAVTVQRTAARRLVWRDDFSGRAGTGVNPRWWTQLEGGHGWGNEELQYYTTGTQNAAVDGNGRLVLTARRDDGSRTCWYGPCTYTSARLVTEGKVTASSGKVEARIKVPDGAGLWPAFWMLGDNIRSVSWPQCGELDIMELVGDWPGEVWSSVHGPGYVRAGLTAPYRLPEGQKFPDAFHTFAMEWTPEGLAFSVDGQVYNRVSRAAIGDNEWVFDKPMHIVLNLAVGGQWPGTPPPTTTFPARMEVDYVAIYR